MTPVGPPALGMLWQLEGTELKLAGLGPEQPDPTGMHPASLHPFPAMQAHEPHSRTTAPSRWARSPSCGPAEERAEGPWTEISRDTAEPSSCCHLASAVGNTWLSWSNKSVVTHDTELDHLKSCLFLTFWHYNILVSNVISWKSF